MMFHKGQKVVYPPGGVGIIDDVRTMEISGSTEEFYIIRIISDNSKVMIPKAKANDVGIRPLIDNVDVDKIFAILGHENPNLILSDKWTKRQREYQELIKNGSIFDLTRLLKQMNGVQQEKELSYSEKKIYENIRKMIVSEIAHVRDIDLSEAENLLAQALV